MNTQNNANVQKYRARMSEEGYARMEVTLGHKFISQARQFAREKQMPFWQFVEQALLAYADSGNGK